MKDNNKTVDSVKYSTLYYDDKLTLPQELRTELKISKKNNMVAIGFAPDKSEFYFWRKPKKSKFDSEVDNRGAIRLPKQLINSSQLKSGDIVTLEMKDNIVEAKIYPVNNNKVPKELMYANTINGQSVPPGWVCLSFTSNPSSHAYYQSGNSSYDNFSYYLNRHNYDPDQLGSVLDFGCGAGRVLRAFHEKNSKTKLYGIDLHKNAIDWCKSNLKYGSFEYGKEMPPLKYDDNQFDFIYAISVFTHLNEKMQYAWFEELQRIAKPGALLIISYRGEDYIINELAPKRAAKVIQELIVNKGILYIEHNSWDGIFPDFYNDTFHTHKYIREEWGRYFDVLELIPNGHFSNKQNAVVLRNSKK